MRLDAETGSHHGVYVVGAGDQVYTFLQKPTPAEVKAAGGVLEDGRVAVDVGLLRFDADLTAALAGLAGFSPLPAVDLYDQITRGLTGQWKPEIGAGPIWQELAKILRAPERPAGFHCAVVEWNPRQRDWRRMQCRARSRDSGMRSRGTGVCQPRRDPAWINRAERAR